MAIFTFTHSRYLFLLFIVPLLFFIHFYSLSNKKKVALKFANFDAIARIQGVDFFSKNLITLFLTALIALSLVLAVSGLTIHIFKEASSFSFVIAIDNSDSMEADDLFPNRLEAAKDTAKNFVDEAPSGTKMGVISFSGNAYIEQDMTNDKIAVKNAIDNIKLEGFGGTDMYETIITSTNILKGEDHKAVILLSDGQANVGELEQIIQYAQENDVIIHTMGVGTEEGGRTYYAISKIDQDSLKTLAYNTGGNYSLSSDKETLARSFGNILSLTRKKVPINLTDYLILFAIILFILEFFISNTKYLNLI